jgi:excisionase family DNA binding protein
MTRALTIEQVNSLPAAPALEPTCHAIGISRSKGYELLAAGEFPIPALRVGNQWRFRLTDLRAYLGLEQSA